MRAAPGSSPEALAHCGAGGLRPHGAVDQLAALVRWNRVTSLLFCGRYVCWSASLTAMRGMHKTDMLQASVDSSLALLLLSAWRELWPELLGQDGGATVSDKVSIIRSFTAF